MKSFQIRGKKKIVYLIESLYTGEKEEEVKADLLLIVRHHWSIPSLCPRYPSLALLPRADKHSTIYQVVQGIKGGGGFEASDLVSGKYFCTVNLACERLETYWFRVIEMA